LADLIRKKSVSRPYFKDRAGVSLCGKHHGSGSQTKGRGVVGRAGVQAVNAGVPTDSRPRRCISELVVGADERQKPDEKAANLRALM